MIHFEVKVAGTRLEKNIYYVTDTCEKALRQWLNQPSSDLPINRDEFILKIFFLSNCADPDLENIIKEQLQLHSERLEYLQGRMELLFPQRDYQQDLGHFLVLDRAISRETEYVTWLNEILSKLSHKVRSKN